MTVVDGYLRVVKGERARGIQTVIDRFLRSLSEAHRGDAIGVILSGSGSVVSAGIEAIRAHGGITIAQEPDWAQATAMPMHAIATGASASC